MKRFDALDFTTAIGGAETAVKIKRMSKGAYPPKTEVFRPSLRTSIRLSLVIFLMTLTTSVRAESVVESGLASDSVRKTRLTTGRITALFSNVIDRGEVQDGRGISAETYWYADGRFISRWWRGQRIDDAPKQQIRGHWRAERNLRCVTLSSAKPSDWSCAEVWLLEDGRVLSLNPDGSAHGLHRLSPLK